MSKSVIDLAKQSGFWQEHLDTWMCSKSNMEFFANLVRNAVLEEVAVEPVSFDQIAVERYKVVPSHDSMFHRWAVVAGDGKQQLYLGREVECQNMAHKFAGAFLDGVWLASQSTPPPPAEVPVLTDDIINAEAAKHQLSTTEERHWYGDNYTVSVNNIKGANDFARAIEQLVRKKSGLK